MTTYLISDIGKRAGMWKGIYMKEEDFLILQAGLRGFGTETDRSYIEFPEYSWCTHNCIGYNRIFLLC